MKKNAAAYGLFDGHIVPLSICSLINFYSSISSVWDSLMFQLISIVDASGFSLIAWSYDLFGGIFFYSLSLLLL